MLNAYRQFMQWRKTQPTLIKGDFKWLKVTPQGLLFERTWEGETLWVAFNLSDKALSFDLPEGDCSVLQGHGFSGDLQGGQVHLAPWDAVYLAVK